MLKATSHKTSNFSHQKHTDLFVIVFYDNKQNLPFQKAWSTSNFEKCQVQYSFSVSLLKSYYYSLKDLQKHLFSKCQKKNKYKAEIESCILPLRLNNYEKNKIFGPYEITSWLKIKQKSWMNFLIEINQENRSFSAQQVFFTAAAAISLSQPSLFFTQQQTFLRADRSEHQSHLGLSLAFSRLQLHLSSSASTKLKTFEIAENQGQRIKNKAIEF